MEKKRCSTIYRILALALTLELAAVFLNSGTVTGITPRADKLKVYAEAERDDRTILPGDILDRNENMIAETKYKMVSGEREDEEKKERVTVYSDGKAFSQLVGYTGSRNLNPNADMTEDVVGDRQDYRLMAFLDEEAWGDNGLYSTVDIDGTKGQSAVLTIDSDLQLAVYKALLEQMSDSEDMGSAIVMDAKTGEILAMVSFPSYDFNDLDHAKAEMLEDAADLSLEPAFPVSYKNSETPGSIFKVLTAVALIDHGMEDFTVENSSFTVNQWTCNAAPYNSGTLRVDLGDTIDLETALNISSNVYFARAALELGADKIRETAERFMLVENSSEEEDTTYLELDFGNVEYNWDLNVEQDILAQTGFGQGRTELTSVYAAMITQAVANDGKMMKPYIIKNLVDANGKTVYTGEKEVLSKATDKSTANKVSKAMRSTASECCNLHGLFEEKEVFDRYQIAGKTGTAENGDEMGSNNAWYISFAPADNPQYVVVVNQCKTNKAGYQMMPAVANIYEYLFETYGRAD